MTNKHVIAGAMSGRFFFTAKGADDQPLVGQRFDVDMGASFVSDWYGHPDPTVDIAVMPLGQLLQAIQITGQDVYYTSVPNDFIPTSAEARDTDAVEDVTFIGYPNGIYDVRNLLPVVRRGITATPFQIDYNGEPKFLIDASVFPGSSGSPVFLIDRGSYMDRSGTVNMGVSRLMLLGVIAEVAVTEERGQIDFAPVPTAQMPIVRMSRMLNLGIVYKSSTIVDAVENALRVQDVIS